MDSFQLLEEKTRRSHSLDPQEMELCMLDYAKLCSDELTVYDFMLENGIGLTNVHFWLERAKYFEADRDFANVLHTIKQAKEIPELSDPNYCLIEEYEQALEQQLQATIHIFNSGKRPMRQQKFDSPASLNSEISKKFRKMGSMVIYVDPPCRKNYRLENLVDHYIKHCSSEMEFGRKQFAAQRSGKPTSWISNKRQRLEYLANQQIQPRLSSSHQLRASENLNNNLANEEKYNQTPNKKLERLRERDSAELLRESFLKRKSQLVKRENKSPRFSVKQNQDSGKEFHSVTENQGKQMQVEILRSECVAPSSECLFSFGKPIVKPMLDITFQNANDMARVESSDFFCSQMEMQDQRMLHNVIKESQISRYQPEVIDMTGVSAIDSQRENRPENEQQRSFVRQTSRERIPLSNLRFEEVVEPELFSQLFPIDVSPLSEDSLRNLEAMLDQESNAPSHSSHGHIRIDSLGFKKPANPTYGGMIGLMSERKERSSLLSEISEEAPASDMKFGNKHTS